MADQVTYLTAEGKQKLQDELEELKNVKRPEIAARSEETRSELQSHHCIS